MRSLCACLAGGLAAAASLCAQSPSTPYAFWTFAGRAAATGTTDGVGSNARFNRPWGIAVDSQGNVYVTESVNHVLRKITPDGVVSTLAGRFGEVGTLDGQGAAARFAAIGTSPISSSPASATGPYGIAVGAGGFGLVADGNSHTLRRFSTAGLISTYAGAAGFADFREGAVLDARFHTPVGVAIDGTGNVYVADTYNQVIRRISPANIVTTIAGVVGQAGSADGIGQAARFLYPTAIAVSPAGTVYVADCNNLIRRLTPTVLPDAWTVTTIAGAPLEFGTTDGNGSAARFAVAPTPASTPGGTTVTFPSFAPVVSPTVSIGASYRLGDLTGLAADGAENVYVCDFSNNTIRKISAAGVVTTIGGATISGSVDGLGSTARFQRPCGIAVDAAGTLYITDAFNHTIRKGAVAVAPVIQQQSGSQTVAAGANISLNVVATGSPPPAIQWSRNSVAIPGATASTLQLNNVQIAQAGTYSATLTNTIGSTFTIPLVLTVTGVPVITTQPSGQSVMGGQTVTLTVTAAASPAPTYQWQRDGAPLPGQTNASLVLTGVQDEHVGEYRVVVTNAFGATTSSAAIVSVNTGRIVNLSIRSALAGTNPLIAGFVVAGGSKPLLIRAVGPALRQFGVSNPVADPQMTLKVGGAVLTTNDNWSTAANAAQISSVAAQVGAFPLTTDSLDAAALATISNNEVTVESSGRTGGGGVVLLELFDTGAATTARLVNVSTRAQAGVGENALFAGFVLGGNSARRLLIRGIGPTLGAFGVVGTLSDPLLEIFSAGATVPRATNDNWNGDASLSATFARVGAFPLPSTASRDAALEITLPPGNYSARVSGMGGATGEVLLEIYEIP